MKRCPTCSQTFDDTVDFCVDDGSALVFGNSVSGYLPTQVITPPAMAGPDRGGSGNFVNVALGAMGAVIVGLAIVLYFLAGSRDAPATQAEVSKSPVAQPTANAIKTSAPSANDQKIIETAMPVDLPPITETAARALVAQWEKAQDARNFAAYRSCYSPNFFGIKRTTDSKEQMKYAAWMADRRKMMPNVVEVQIDNPSYTMDGDAIVVRFTQKWRSVNVCDIGPKTLRIKMTENGPKIVYEVLDYSSPC